MRARVIVIGAGKMGRAHLEAFRGVPEAEVVGIVSRRGPSAAALAAEFSVACHGTDWSEVANEADADAAVVAVSHEFNEQISREVLEKGLHLLAEKPVAVSSSAVAALAAMAASKRRIALAAMNRRFYPGLSSGLDLARLAGTPYHIHITAPDSAEPRRIDGTQTASVCDNWFFMNTIHAVDLLRMMGGEPVRVVGFRKVQNRPDHVTLAASLLFDSGLLGTFVMPGGLNVEWDLRLSGDGFQLEARPLEMTILRTDRKNSRGIRDGTPSTGTKMGLFEQARVFSIAVQSGDAPPPPASDLADHAKTLALVEALSRLPSR